MASHCLIHTVKTASKSSHHHHVFKAIIESVKDYKECTIPIRKLTLRALGFEHDPSAVFTYKSGQWVDFIIPHVERVGEYSCISSPNIELTHTLATSLEMSSLPCFDLAIKRSSHPSAAWVHSEKCQPEVEVEVRVGGDYSLNLLNQQPSAPQTICFIAGGVGINPLYSMLVDLVGQSSIASSTALPPQLPINHNSFFEKHSTLLPLPSILLIWSVKSLDDAYLYPQLLQLAATHRSSSILENSQFKIILAVTGGDEPLQTSSDNMILCDFDNTFQDIIRAPFPSTSVKLSQDDRHTTTNTRNVTANSTNGGHSTPCCVIEKSHISSAMIQKYLFPMQQQQQKQQTSGRDCLSIPLVVAQRAGDHEADTCNEGLLKTPPPSPSHASPSPSINSSTITKTSTGSSTKHTQNELSHTAPVLSPHQQVHGVVDTASTVAFVCGPPGLTEDVVRMLIEDCSLERDAVYTERWW